jgi:hypothetical protein
MMTARGIARPVAVVAITTAAKEAKAGGHRRVEGRAVAIAASVATVIIVGVVVVHVRVTANRDGRIDAACHGVAVGIDDTGGK